jgi:hypothetical protein
VAEGQHVAVESRKVTHDWESNNAIREEVVVQAGEVGAASCAEFECCMNLYCERVSIFNHIQEFLLLFLELATLVGEVFADFGWAIEGGESCNVVQRRIISQQRGVWSIQKLSVCSLKRHGARELFIRKVLMSADARARVVEGADP